MISKEMGIFIGIKKLESMINKKNLYNENSGLRAIREKANKKTTQLKKGKELLEKLVHKK